MRLRLILAFAFVILVTLLGVAIFMRQGATQEVRAFIYRGGIYGEQDFVAALESHYRQNGSWEGVQALFQALGRGSGQGRGKGQGRGAGNSRETGEYLRLYGADMSLVYDPHDPGANAQFKLEDASSAIPLKVDGVVVGYLMPPGGMIIDQDLDASLLDQLNEALLNAAMIAGAISLVLASFLAYYLLRPVRDLRQAAVSMSQGDLSARVQVRGKDELSTLGEAFNQMADSLEQEQRRRSDMTADIAHELRTPLAVQQANLEAMLDGVYPLAAENLQPILEQNQLLIRLVADLRTIALAEAGELKLQVALTNMNQLVRSVVERFALQAERRQIRLIMELDEGCPVMEVDLERIEQILINLLANALRHTPQGGRISVGTGCTSGMVALQVRDSGPGIPPEALPFIFERFYRGDRSRCREAGGSGLGLAIARKLAEAHGGTLTAQNHPGGGALFILRLPLKDQPGGPV